MPLADGGTVEGVRVMSRHIPCKFSCFGGRWMGGPEKEKLTVLESQGAGDLVDTVRGVEPLPGVPDVVELGVVEVEGRVAGAGKEVYLQAAGGLMAGSVCSICQVDSVGEGGEVVGVGDKGGVTLKPL